MNFKMCPYGFYTLVLICIATHKHTRKGHNFIIAILKEGRKFSMYISGTILLFKVSSV